MVKQSTLEHTRHSAAVRLTSVRGCMSETPSPGATQPPASDGSYAV